LADLDDTEKYDPKKYQEIFSKNANDLIMEKLNPYDTSNGRNYFSEAMNYQREL
jgi:hypothetical protein